MMVIEPESVVSAFREIGMKPIRHRFINDKLDACCALTALAVPLRGEDHVLKNDRWIADVVPSVLALTEKYWHGFVSGWNGVDPRELCDDHEDTPLSLKARSEGEAAWLACKNEGLVEE
jgi:hypothetical protein